MRTFFLSLIVALTFLSGSIHYKVSIDKPVLFEIQKGSSSSAASKLLEHRDLIISDFLFNLYMRVLATDKSIKAGEYLIEKSESIYSYAKKFSKGPTFQRKLTLLPGMTLHEIYNLRNQEGIVNDLGVNPEAYLNKIKIPYKEGVFFPDTYFFQKGDSYSSILEKAHEKWKLEFLPLWHSRNKNLPYANLMEAITLASIIEKEGLEKNKIAGVFINRLSKKMKLQSDPTVIYALGKDFDGDIKRKDLQIDNPYNTYKNKGLPPGPISIVSKSSLIASLNPLQSDYLYFVSMGNGFHKFSKNLTEHNEAVLKYQINAR